MTDLHLTTLSGKDLLLEQAAVAAFQQSLRSQLIWWTRSAPRNQYYEKAYTGTVGVYIDNIGREEDDGAEQVRAAYSASYPRLVELKQKYDPTNLFRHNQNIPPAVYGELAPDARRPGHKEADNRCPIRL